MSLAIKTSTKPFQMISPLSTDRNPSTPDLLDLLVGLSPAAQTLFLEIKRKHNFVTNVCSYELPEHVANDRKGTPYKLYSRYVSSIIKSGIMVRLKKDHVRQLGLPEKDNVVHFLVNPHLIRCKEFGLANSIWTAYPKK